ncbi:type II secretion system protein [Propionivibrio sp.]|uniref:type II secretion system protein n=1 Tax=Propionivibrio sp. TaxID=2212460 RepID=UPI003BF18D7F
MAESNRRKVELAIVVVIIAALASFLLPALERSRMQIEEAMVQTEAAAIRVELLDRLAHREAFGGDLPQSANPLRWIGRVPEAYLGELDAAPAARNVWYFDTRTEVLVYRFRSSGEARFRLTRGITGANTAGVLAGVGLIRE